MARDKPQNPPNQPDPASYAFDPGELATLGDQTDPVETRKELLRQLGGMMASAATRRRKLANNHTYADPDFTTVLRGFELAGKWLGIDRAPGDPKELLRISQEMKALIAGQVPPSKSVKGKK
jgi:hypothetical protein